MNILIAGASGFIGKQLVKSLQASHTITVLGRDKSKLQQQFSYPINSISWDALANWDANTFDVIINLCGNNIASTRWTATIKKELIDSRVTTTSSLIKWAIENNAKPRFICANAVGIYGVQSQKDATVLDEDSSINLANPSDFLSEIGVRWQQALQPAIDFGMSVASTRFGVVIGKKDGFLKKLLPSFYVGLGSVIGDGDQVLSWVDCEDVTGAIAFLLDKPALTGAFNLTSPNPVTQKQFAQTLAKVLHRPLLLKLPAFLVTLLFGEMGDYLLLRGQRVKPKRLIEAGYHFKYTELAKSLQHNLAK